MDEASALHTEGGKGGCFTLQVSREADEEVTRPQGTLGTNKAFSLFSEAGDTYGRIVNVSWFQLAYI